MRSRSVGRGRRYGRSALATKEVQGEMNVHTRRTSPHAHCGHALAFSCKEAGGRSALIRVGEMRVIV